MILLNIIEIRKHCLIMIKYGSILVCSAKRYYVVYFGSLIGRAKSNTPIRDNCSLTMLRRISINM